MDPVKVIPCLDVRDGRVVKGVHFVDLRDAADPVEAAEAYSEGGADEIVFLDITATVEGRQTAFDVLAGVAAVSDVPLTLGGGIRSIQDIEAALAAGANSVSVSSAAYRDPQMVAEAVRQFGPQRIIVAIDADANDGLPSGREVYIDGGRTATQTDVVQFARRMADIGVGRILATSKAMDGVKRGYDIALTRGIAQATGLPVVASGGAGTLEHFYEAATEGLAQGLLAASVFHFGLLSIREVKGYLAHRGVPVKL